VAAIALQGRLSEDAERWLARAVDAIKVDARAIRALFRAVGRKCGRDRLRSAELPGWTIDEAARVVLLDALPAGVLPAGIAGLDRRVDDELITMLRAFAAERAAAGRSIPADVTRLLPLPLEF